MIDQVRAAGWPRRYKEVAAMARMARLVVPHYSHHVTQRGNRRQRVFFSEDDYRAYLALVREACGAAETAVLA